MRQIALLILLILFIGCEERKAQTELPTPPDSTPPPAYVSIDTSDGKRFRAVIQEGKSSIVISESEIHLIDKLLQNQVEKHNRKVDKRFSIDLSKYKRQYFPSVNGNGEKEVEVNCFCRVHDGDDWKKHRVEVDDGGSCYFKFKVNLKTKRVLGFTVNGEA